MKKVTIIVCFSLVVILSFVINSCTNEPSSTSEDVQKEEIGFSVIAAADGLPASAGLNSASIFNTSFDLNDAHKAIITIQFSDGSPTAFTQSELTLYDFGGELITQKIALEVGSYQVSEFFVADASDNVIFASPLEGSAQAQNVSDALPVFFNVANGQIDTLAIEVLSTEALTPADFGFESFNIQANSTFSFLISVLEQGQNIALPATITITSASYTFVQDVSADINHSLTIRDSYTDYTITVESSGYQTFVDIFQIDTLQHYDGLPLIIELEKIPEPSWNLLEIPNWPDNAAIRGLWADEQGLLLVAGQLMTAGTSIGINIYSYLEGNWKMEYQVSGSKYFNAFDGSGNDDIFFNYRDVSADETKIFHSDGTNWTQQTMPPEFGNNHVQGIVGEKNNTYIGGGSKIFKYDGTDWQYETDLGRGTNLVYINSNEIYALDCWGHTLWNGSTWTWHGSFDFCDIGRSWGMRDANNNLHMYVIGSNSFGNGIRVWRFVEDSPGSMTGSWGSKYDCTYLCDPPGSGYRWAGAGNDIWGSSPDNIYAVGGHGWTPPHNSGVFTPRIYHFNGTAPFDRMTQFDDFPIELTADARWLRVTGTGPNDVWISAGKKLFHYGVP